jgi:uncharacterized membrane protein
MADEGDLGRPVNPDGKEPSPEFMALQQRVARLELELAALQSGIAAKGADQRVAWRPSSAVPTAPPPLPVLGSPPPATVRRVTSQAWASARPFAAPVPESRDSFESRLGSQIFNRIGIVLLLSGTAYFLKLAIDRQWIGPTGRVLTGLLAGAALVVWSERFRHKGFAAFSYSLKALGSGVLYLSLWAAFQLFHLLPAPAALLLMVAVTAWNAYMAWVQDSELLAVYAMAGGFATPMLLSTGANHEVFLFTYLLAIDVAIVALVRLKMWPRLLLGAFPLTVAFFIAWYAEFYAATELTTTSIFIALFGLAFASVPLGRATANSESTTTRFPSLIPRLEDILLPLVNSAFVALALYSVLQDSGHHDLLPWMMLVLSAAYLGLMRAPQTRTASAIHLSIAVVFLTIAIPLKANGHWITVSWLVEGLALLWVATRLEPSDVPANSDESYASSTLRWLAVGSLVLGFCGICTHSTGLVDVVALPLWNKGTGTALTGIAVFAAAALLALTTAKDSRAERAQMHTLGWDTIAVIAFILIELTGILLTLRELIFSWAWSDVHPPFQTADFFTAMIGLAVIAGVVGVSHRLARKHSSDPFWINCAALSTIAFNLIAVLTGVREIEAIWGSSPVTADGALQQALAISAFLMLYGAALLAAGFWRRNGFLRWQALVLLVFTIFKTFLYDMRNLSQGYRVVSFLGLGALLMAISFAYQKDWLNLRGAVKGPGIGTEPDAEPKTDSGAAR